MENSQSERRETNHECRLDQGLRKVLILNNNKTQTACVLKCWLRSSCYTGMQTLTTRHSLKLKSIYISATVL